MYGVVKTHRRNVLLIPTTNQRNGQISQTVRLAVACPARQLLPACVFLDALCVSQRVDGVLQVASGGLHSDLAFTCRVSYHISLSLPVSTFLSTADNRRHPFVAADCPLLFLTP